MSSLKYLNIQKRMFAFSRFRMSAYNYILKEEAGRCRKPKTIRYNET